MLHDADVLHEALVAKNTLVIFVMNCLLVIGEFLRSSERGAAIDAFVVLVRIVRRLDVTVQTGVELVRLGTLETFVPFYVRVFVLLVHVESVLVFVDATANVADVGAIRIDDTPVAVSRQISVIAENAAAAATKVSLHRVEVVNDVVVVIILVALANGRTGRRIHNESFYDGADVAEWGR